MNDACTCAGCHRQGDNHQDAVAGASRGGLERDDQELAHRQPRGSGPCQIDEANEDRGRDQEPQGHRQKWMHPARYHLGRNDAGPDQRHGRGHQHRRRQSLRNHRNAYQLTV